ncbi:lipopolysaccharide biosynthesis protein [Novosphingobium resinovorum]|uniref:Polysaccharide biosynthesis protein n=2 Tax=Sphingomonadaceae TaxID=41297 RepID=A0A031K0D8_9SPHN|nr:lipopolysaccharide biosynthesis protein [Novosphingobium resinovorum]AOR79108.1 hypothetical protein BES08_19660 [Novosphingobium resinovorum]EZP82685.1 Polysaccharide biosynthesis protein [Novosphingobium resinovorum]
MNRISPDVAKPLFWSTASSLGTQALSFLTFAILARLLGAPAFGLVAMAALVIDLLLTLSTIGMNEAVVQRRSLTEEDADTAFWANLACGLLCCVVTVAAAPLLARLFDQPELAPIVAALASIFAITPLGTIHTARLQRELRFRSVAARSLAASLAGALVGLPLALAGFGAWALVGQRIGASAAMAVSAWISTGWMPRPRFKCAACRDMMRFGVHLGIAGTLNQINIRSAEVISGILVGPAAVAFIRAGSRIVEVLNQVTYAPFQQIALPVLARTAHDLQAMRTTYLRMSRLSAFVMFPAFFGTLALSRQVVDLVFGPGWEPVADAIRIFACAVVPSQMNTLVVAAIASAGESRTVLAWTSTQIVLGLAAAAAVHDWGWQAMLMTGVVRGYLVLPYGLYLLRKRLEIPFRDVFASLRPALTSSALMVVLILACVRTSEASISPLGIIAFALPSGVVTYVGSYIWQDPAILVQARDMLRSRLCRNAPR